MRHMIAVHPRVCGELGAVPPEPGRLGRFIPACAGNSCSAPLRWARPAVHPRVCGELALCAVAEAEDNRFIPACAGNSPDAR